MAVERCLGCLKQKQGEQRCPFCGFDPNDAVVAEVLPPKTVLRERYLLGKAVQRDGEGITYLGIEQQSGQPLWIREYFPAKLGMRDGLCVVTNRGSETHFKTLQSEFIELYQQLISLKGSPHLISVVDLFRANDTVYAVLLFVSGVTLAEYLHDHAGELSPEEALQLFVPMLETLGTLHQAGLIHRGISPKSLLVTQGRLLLTGFSVAALQIAGSEIDQSLAAGYAAPEQYGKSKQHGTWTDVYALSAVLYKALSGTMPPEASMRAVNDNLISLHQLNAAVPETMSQAVARGMAYDPEQRTRTVQVLRAGLSATHLHTGTTTAVFGTKPVLPPDDVVLYSDQSISSSEEEPQNRGMALWKKTLLFVTPMLLLLIVLLYWLILGKGCAKDPSPLPTSSEVSSEPLSSLEESSEPESSSEAVSSEEASSGVEQIVVDNFVNRRYQDIVTDVAYQNKFKFSAVYGFSATFPVKGTVIDQSVRFGSKVDPGTEIVLTVSDGPRFVEIPSLQTLASWRASDFQAELEKNYLTASISSEKRYSDTVPAGHVIGIEGVRPGSQVDRERTPDVKVTIFESAGVAPNSPETPEYPVEPVE